MSVEDPESYHSSIRVIIQRAGKTLVTFILTTVISAISLSIIAGMILLFEHYWEAILIMFLYVITGVSVLIIAYWVWSVFLPAIGLREQSIKSQTRTRRW
jgi:ABC-type amino acid transport system permease subunit